MLPPASLSRGLFSLWCLMALALTSQTSLAMPLTSTGRVVISTTESSLRIGEPSVGSTEWSAPTTSGYVRQFYADYVHNDEHLQTILDQLREEAIDRLAHPQNYVNDDVPLDEIIKLFENNDAHEAAESSWGTNLATEQNQSGGDHGSSEEEDTECAICQEELASAHAKLMCGHRFHKKCLLDWFRYQMNTVGGPTCPMCRSQVRSIDRLD